MDILEKKPIEKMFPKQQLLDWGLPYNDPIILDEHGYVLVRGEIFFNQEIVGIGHHLNDDNKIICNYIIIFSEPEDNSKIWKTCYSLLKKNYVYAKEYLIQDPWSSYKFIRCTQVHYGEKTIKVWEEVLED